MTFPPAASPSTDAIQPGLMVVHGNHLEDLRDLLVEWLAHAPLAPLEDEVLLVQSNGIAQWLKLALARPLGEGGMGISAAVDMQLPGRFLWQAYRAVLGGDAIPKDSPFDKSRLLWRLMRLLPRQLAQPDFAPLRHFLGAQADPEKLFQLAGQVADLFDQYQVYRADWLDDWARRRDVVRNDLRGTRTPLDAAQRWQAQLWRALLADVGPEQQDSHRAAVHRAFMQRVATLEARPAALPRRVVVFGMSSLPQQTLEALTALGRLAQVFLLVANPCRHYWGDIIEDRELLRAEHHRHGAKPGMAATPRFEDLHAQANPLLAAWGKQGRDYIRLLDSYDQPEAYRGRLAALGRDIDLFGDPGQGTLLHQVQHAILELEPLPVAAQRRPLVAGDDSLRFHIAHNAQREVEILHDNLLAMFEAAQARGTPLAPHDVMVMVPDIETYAPHIQAVFGRMAPDDPRHLPCSIADRSARGSAPLLAALDYLLHLPTARCTAGELLDLLDAPALRRRFGVDAGSLPLLRQWIAGAGIRWGLSAAHKHDLGLPQVEQNTWRFGLRRMLLGYAVGDGAALDGIAPYDEIGGLDAQRVGPLAMLIDQLEHHRQQLARPATPEDWTRRLRALLDDFFDAGRDNHDATLLQRLGDALEAWERACEEAKRSHANTGHAAKSGDAPGLLLPLTVVREHWLATMDDHRLSQRFLGGAVSFGTLLPMRAIPFRVICLLGMNDGDYPRRGTPPDFDLMAEPGQQRPGDRSRREDDRYLFLEALLAARDQFYVSWVGRNERDNSVLPPSVLVGQLRDYLAAGWEDPLSLLTTTYPLQAFSPRYFDAGEDPRLFTYAHKWDTGGKRGQVHFSIPLGHPEAHWKSEPDPLFPLSPWQPEGPLDIPFLQRFLRSPAQAFYATRLGVYFDAPDTGTDDDEPFALDSLERHAIGSALLTAGLDGDASAVTTAGERLREQGLLPTGGFGALALASPLADANDAAENWHELARRWPDLLPPRAVQYADHALALADWLGDLRRDGAGYMRLAVTVSRLKDPSGALRADKLLGAWATHLVANAAAFATTSVIVGADAAVHLEPLATDAARAHLHTLLDAIAIGMCRPLPVARKTAYAWLAADDDDKREAKARARYNHNEHGKAPGEVEQDACLARHWPHFDALHAAGFEDWLPLYQPLLAALREGAPA